VVRVSITILAVVVGLAGAYVIAHLALIETGREVVVLHTQDADGELRETRLWVVDEDGAAWLHGSADSAWMRNLARAPAVEVERDGRRGRYQAILSRGSHEEIDAALRKKYGVADRWVRFVAPDNEVTTVVRLEPRDRSPSAVR
jgi:hypothetical protein